jgi:N-acetylglucosamine-6-sulfatase
MSLFASPAPQENNMRVRVALTALLLAAVFVPPQAHADTKPNIIFILADDLNEDVFDKATGLQTLLTANGTRFANSFVSVSLCCPSRVASLRGQVAHNTGVFTNNAPDGGFAKVYADGLEKSTIATWLQAAGYRTALVGKYLNGYPTGAPSNTYIPPGWTRWWSPISGSFYSQYDYTLNENGTAVSYGSSESDYFVDVISRKTVTFIQNTVTNYPGTPFFVYVAPSIPHGPATPPQRYLNDFPNAQAPRTPSFNEADVSDKPEWVRSKPLLTSAQITSIDDLYRKRRASFKAVKDLVQDIIDTLAATNQLDNTYIFFASDNGFHQGQHRLNSGKNSAYEEDIRVPLVVRGPGVAAGRVVPQLTGNIDFAPTFAELAGVTPPSFVDGRSLVPILHGLTPPTWRKAFLLEHGGPSITVPSSDPSLEPQDPFDVEAQATGAAPVFAGIRTADQALTGHGPLSYIEYDTGERELYDLSVDGAQLNNAYNASGASLKTKLSNWLGSLRHTAGAAFRAAEEAAP